MTSDKALILIMKQNKIFLGGGGNVGTKTGGIHQNTGEQEGD
jgi:hypothetical protein